ncbi:hypothetical protein LJC40_04855 [Synergistaceae bacterium OttesenSCG-928-D05]|nr:hypothetical protein [Synergistaceae bacterium OttesenSCG-928-D05]
MAKPNRNNKVLKYALVGVVLLLVVGWTVLSRIDFMGDMVLTQVRNAVQDLGGIELDISPLRGNPLTGFEGTDLALRSGDVVLLRAVDVGINISLPSVLTGSPRIGLLRLDGLRSDWDDLMAMLPKQNASSGPIDIPINKIELNDTQIETQWGAFALDNSSVRLRGSEWFGLDLQGSLHETPGKLSGVIEKKDGSWTFGRLNLKLAGGTARLDGSVYPSLDLAVKLNEIDLAETAELIPQLRKVGILGDLSGEATVTGLGADMMMTGSASLKKALIFGVPFPQVSAQWSYEEKLIRVKLDEGKVFQSSLTGDFMLDLRSENGYLELDAGIRDLRFDDWSKKLSDFPAAAHFGGGITSLDAKVKGPLNALEGVVELAPSSLRYKKIEIENIQGKTLFAGKPSGNVDFSADYMGNKMTLLGTVSFAEGVPADLRFDAGSLVLDQLGDVFEALQPYAPKGIVAVKAAMTGPVGSWLFRGDVSSPQVVSGMLGEFQDVHVSPQYSFKDGSFVLDDVKAVWNGASVTGRGNLSQAAAGALDFSGTFSGVSAKRFYTLLPVLETLAIDAAADGVWRIDGTAESPRVIADAESKQGAFRGVEVDALRTTVTFIPGQLTLNPLHVNAGGGTADLTCIVNIPQNTKSGAKISWELDGKVTGVSPAIANGVLGMEEDFGGKVSGTIMAGDIGDGLIWSFDVGGSDVSWRGFKADEATGKVRGDMSLVQVEDMVVTFLRGKTSVSGTIELTPAGTPMAEGALDLKIDAQNMNIYELLRRHLPMVRGFQGLAASSINVGGTIGDPQISGEGTIRPFRYRSFFLPILKVAFTGGLSGLDIDAKAMLLYGSLDAKVKVSQTDWNWSAKVDVEGKEIDFLQIALYLPEEFREKLSGKADIKMHGELSDGAFNADGTFSSNEMLLFGVSVEDINAPFYVMDGYAIMEDVRAKSNGGTFEGGLAYDIENDSWGGNITIADAEIVGILQQAAPDMKGSLTGQAGLKVRAAGDMGRTSTVKAAGVLFLKDGEISGFDAVEAARKFTRGNPIRFDTVQVSFNLDGDYLTILPGSQAIAPPDDPVYRNVMLDGTVDPKGSLSMFCMGKVNIRALNALLGAIQGIMNLGIDLNESLNKEELLQGLLSGMIGGFSQNEFRFFTMNVKGTLFAPKFENIRVENNMKGNKEEAIPRALSDPKEDDFASGNTTFRFKFQIPVGPGGRSKESGVDDQVKGQVLQNALDSLIKGIDF